MAIKVFDGFDHYTSLVDVQSRVGALQWSDVYLSSGTLAVSTGRGGYGFCVGLNADSTTPSQFGGSFNAYLTAAITGVAVLMESLPEYTFVDLQVMDYTHGDYAQLTIRFYLAGGSITIYSGDPGALGLPGVIPTGTVLAQSNPNVFSPYIWNFFEISYVISGTSSGNVTVQVNGANALTFSGANTFTGGTNTSSGFRIRPSVATNGAGTGQTGIYIDDFYLCDTTTGPGTFPANTFLGDSAVRTLFPTANASVQWTPLTSTNYAEVGEVHFDGDTSYNYATTVGNTDLFSFGSLPTQVSTVYAVQTTGAYRKQDSGGNTIVQEISSTGTVASGSAHVLSLNYGYYTDLFVLDPRTGATFTTTAVDALEAGYKLNS